jgi:hypothetical protein
VIQDAVTISSSNNNQPEFEILNDNFKIKDFKLYPNPANTFINVEFSEIPENGVLIEVNDSNGRTLYKKTAESMSNKIDIGNFPAGLYFVRSVSNNNINVKKLIISNSPF